MKLLLALALACISRAAPPTITGSSWRHIDFVVSSNPISLTLIELLFDQDLYVNISGTMTLLPDYRQSIGEWPEIAYRLQGSLGVTCGANQAKKYNYPSGVPDYILVIPPTDDPMATFFGYFAGFFLDTVAAPKKLPFVVLHDNGQNIQSGLTKAQLDACLSAGTLQIELFPSPCRPTAGQVTAANAGYLSNNPGATPPYNANDLFCAILNQGGEAIAPTNFTNLPTSPVVGDCSETGVDQLIADVSKLRDFIQNQVNSRDDLNGIDFAEVAIQTRSAYGGCKAITEQVITMETKQKNIGDSTECPDRSNTSAPAFLSNPCCNHREGVCCVPQPVIANYQSPKDINTTELLGVCPPAQTDPVIQAILLTFAINLNREANAPAPENINVLYTNLFWNPYNECQNTLYSQRCSADSQCYTRNCDPRGGRCNQDPNGDALPMIRCLVEKYNGGSGVMTSAILDFFNLDASITDPETVAQNIYAAIDATTNASDCVGQSAWDFRAQVRDVRDPSTGAWTRQLVTANQTGCLGEQRCNWNSWQGLNPTECVTRGGSEYFCGVCGQGNQCEDITEVPVCRFNWKNYFIGQSDCLAIGGVYEYADKYGSSPACLRQSINETLAQGINGCLDQNICPGPNSPSQWIQNLFTMPEHDNYACNDEICYDSTLNETECWALRNMLWSQRTACEAAAAGDPVKLEACADHNVYWNIDYRDGAGLCVKNVQWGNSLTTMQNMQVCTNISGRAFSFYGGAVYRHGKYATEQDCANANVCLLPNRSPFNVATASDCTSQGACDFSCPACVQTRSAEGTLFCSAPLNQTACTERKEGDPQWDSVSMTCIIEVGNSAACSALSGTMVTCRDYSQSQCGNSSLPYQSELNCQFREWAPCQNQTDCNMQGECEDWDLSNWENCFENGGCNICVYPFPKDPMNRTITRCGVPIVNGYPCERHCGLNPTYSDYRWSRFGCILNNQANTPNQSMCEASTAPYDSSLNGIWMGRAKTQTECENRASACLRFGGWRLRTSAASCADCGGQVSTLYTWRSGQFQKGRIQSVSWRKRQFQSVNSYIPTLPLANVQQELEKVVARYIGTLEGNRVISSYDFRFNIYKQLIRACNGSISGAVAVGGLTGTCKCFGGGKPCEGLCPFECPFPCSYDILQFIAAVFGVISGAGRRRLQQNQVTTDIVRDGAGNIVGAYVGDALQLNGTLTGTRYICIADNLEYGNISAAYTVYDFAAAIPPNNGPGIPLGIATVRQGTSTCANLTIGATAYYPIKRLPNFVMTTSAPSVATTTTPNGGGAATTPNPNTNGTATTTPPGGSGAPAVMQAWVALIVAVLGTVVTW